MRFMIIVKATPETESGVMPTSEELAAMGRYNEELIDAGILLAGEGLHPSSKGARIKFDKGQVTVTDGPFSESKELIAGFWMIQVKSRDEALEWIRRIPFSNGEEVEMRQVFETSEFAADDITAEHLAKEEAWRNETQKIITR